MNAKRGRDMTTRLLLAVAALGFSTPALADAPAPGPLYGGVHLGLTLFTDSDMAAPGLGPGTATIEWEAGFAAGAVAGYRFGESFRLEAEFSYKRAKASKVAGDSGSGVSLSTPGLFVNAYYDITQAKLPVTPFLGAGVGAIVGYFKVPGEKANTTVFAYQLTLGVLYAASNEVLLSAAYRYQGSQDFKYTFAGVPDKVIVPYGSHNVLAGLSYFF